MNFMICFTTTLLLLFICKTVYLQDSASNDIMTEHTVPCEEGWRFFGQNCYKEIKERVTWDEASAECNTIGANLVSIHSQAEQDFIVGILMPELNDDSWIGLHDTENEGTFVWTDGSNVNFTLWHRGQPDNFPYNNSKEENCGQLYYKRLTAHRGSWNDFVCSYDRPYICKKERNEALSSPDPFFCSIEEGGGCKFRGTCYNFVNQKKSWKDAEQYCRDMYKGHLVTILNSEIDWFIDYFLKKYRGYVWIGIKLQDQLQQKWLSGWYVAYNLLPKDITSAFVEDICILRSRSPIWVEKPCYQEYPFICESSKENPISLKNSFKGWNCPESSNEWRDMDGEFCYYFNTSPLAWYEANTECIKRGGNLASIHSEEESNALQSLMSNNNIRAFIGLNSLLTRGLQYTWSDGTRLDITNWYGGQPSAISEQCGEVYSYEMRWNDVSCDRNNSFICSTKKVPPIESSPEEIDQSPDGVSTNIMAAKEFMSSSYCFCFPL